MNTSNRFWECQDQIEIRHFAIQDSQVLMEHIACHEAEDLFEGQRSFLHLPECTLGLLFANQRPFAERFDSTSGGMNHGFVCAPDRRLGAIVGFVLLAILGSYCSFK